MTDKIQIERSVLKQVLEALEIADQRDGFYTWRQEIALLNKALTGELSNTEVFKLPPLPVPARRQGQQMAEDGNDKVFFDCFDPKQMQDYARAALAMNVSNETELQKALINELEHNAELGNIICQHEIYVAKMEAELLTLHNALNSDLQLGSWQPIETAPEETEVFIGRFIDGQFKFGKSEMFYEQANEFAGETFSGWVWSEDECSSTIAENPTHWMALPDAPPDPTK